MKVKSDSQVTHKETVQKDFKQNWTFINVTHVIIYKMGKTYNRQDKKQINEPHRSTRNKSMNLTEGQETNQ